MQSIEKWFLKLYTPDICNFQENVLHILPDDVKALLILDNAPVHPHEDRLVSSDGKIYTTFLLPNTTVLIQPVDQGIMAAYKRFYQRHYLNNVWVTLEEPKDLDLINSDTRG